MAHPIPRSGLGKLLLALLLAAVVAVGGCLGGPHPIPPEFLGEGDDANGFRNGAPALGGQDAGPAAGGTGGADLDQGGAGGRGSGNLSDGGVDGGPWETEDAGSELGR